VPVFFFTFFTILKNDSRDVVQVALVSFFLSFYILAQRWGYMVLNAFPHFSPKDVWMGSRSGFQQFLEENIPAYDCILYDFAAGKAGYQPHLCN